MPANAELECPCRRKYDNHELTVEALMQERKVSAALLAHIRVIEADLALAHSQLKEYMN